MPAPPIDPELAALFAGRAGRPLPVGDALEETRAEQRLALEASRPSERVDHEDHAVPGAPGSPAVTVRVYRPIDVSPSAPCLFHIHGGGYLHGNRAMDDARFERWCPTHGVVGVSVEYRLAPETPFPGPLEDCYAALRWVHEYAPDLGIDPTRIGIAGASAGGGLAAALALLARDRGELPIAFQLLAYPMIDDRQITPSSHWEVVSWSPEHNECGWRAYLGDLYGKDDVPYLAAPARAEDLRGLPPTYLFVGTGDGFCDENLHYAMKLYQAGVPTEVRVYHGGPHGFDSIAPDAELSNRARRDADDWLARTLAALGS